MEIDLADFVKLYNAQKTAREFVYACKFQFKGESIAERAEQWLRENQEEELQNEQ